MNKLRIMLADDHEVIRDGLRVIINSQPDMEVVCEAGNGRDALQMATECRPNVVVMDISMPRLNGLQATMAMKRSMPHIKVLPLTRHTDSAHLQQLLGAGASGFVLKQSPANELLRAIRVVATGGTYLDPAIAGKILVNHFGRVAGQRPENQPALSDREIETLRLIAQGYSNKEIAASLNLSVKTIETHKANAMKKLDLNSRIDIVRYAVLCGWLQDT